MSNVKVKLRNKTYNQNTDNAAGVIVFDTEHKSTYVGGTEMTPIFKGTNNLVPAKGFVPAPVLNQDEGKFLKSDGTWSNVTAGDIHIQNLVTVTSIELIKLIKTNQLVPGCQYRITDYKMTSDVLSQFSVQPIQFSPYVEGEGSQENIDFHQFLLDIIVTAATENQLETKAKLITNDSASTNLPGAEYTVPYVYDRLPYIDIEVAPSKTMSLVDIEDLPEDDSENLYSYYNMIVKDSIVTETIVEDEEGTHVEKDYTYQGIQTMFITDHNGTCNFTFNDEHSIPTADIFINKELAREEINDSLHYHEYSVIAIQPIQAIEIVSMHDYILDIHTNYDFYSGFTGEVVVSEDSFYPFAGSHFPGMPLLFTLTAFPTYGIEYLNNYWANNDSTKSTLGLYYTFSTGNYLIKSIDGPYGSTGCLIFFEKGVVCISNFWTKNVQMSLHPNLVAVNIYYGDKYKMGSSGYNESLTETSGCNSFIGPKAGYRVIKNVTNSCITFWNLSHDSVEIYNIYKCILEVKSSRARLANLSSGMANVAGECSNISFGLPGPSTSMEGYKNYVLYNIQDLRNVKFPYLNNLNSFIITALYKGYGNFDDINGYSVVKVISNTVTSNPVIVKGNYIYIDEPGTVDAYIANSNNLYVNALANASITISNTWTTTAELHVGGKELPLYEQNGIMVTTEQLTEGTVVISVGSSTTSNVYNNGLSIDFGAIFEHTDYGNSNYNAIYTFNSNTKRAKNIRLIATCKDEVITVERYQPGVSSNSATVIELEGVYIHRKVS